MNENITLFPTEKTEKTEKPLEVIKVNFERMCTMHWKELFSGYQRLYAITFSYGLNFMEKILEEFEYAEIILGCEPLVKFDLQTIMAHQTLSIKEIEKHHYLVERVKEENVTFYVSKEITSHQKIFILEGNNMNTRIITGSGNFSERSFAGDQLENITLMDNDLNAYQYYMECFETLKALSTTEIVKDALFCNPGEEFYNIGDLPIAKEVQMSNVGIIIKESKEDPDKINYVYNLKSLAKQYANLVPAKDKKGKILLTAKKVTHMVAMQKNKMKSIKKKKLYIHNSF